MSEGASKPVRKVGVQALICVGAGRDIGEELARCDEVALGLDRIGLHRIGNGAVWQLGVFDALVPGFDVGGEVLADKTVEQRAQDKLFEVPAIDRAPHLIGNSPDFAV